MNGGGEPLSTPAQLVRSFDSERPRVECARALMRSLAREFAPTNGPAPSDIAHIALHMLHTPSAVESSVGYSARARLPARVSGLSCSLVTLSSSPPVVCFILFQLPYCRSSRKTTRICIPLNLQEAKLQVRVTYDDSRRGRLAGRIEDELSAMKNFNSLIRLDATL